jgi:hypothetical protein
MHCAPPAARCAVSPEPTQPATDHDDSDGWPRGHDETTRGRLHTSLVGARDRPDDHTMRTVITLFLIGHGAVHAIMWTLPFTDAVDDMPFDPASSWLLGERRTAALVLAGVTTAAFVVTAIAFAIAAGWWPISMLVAVTLSMALLTAFFTPWWTVGILINLGLAVYAWLRLT